MIIASHDAHKRGYRYGMAVGRERWLEEDEILERNISLCGPTPGALEIVGG